MSTNAVDEIRHGAGSPPSSSSCHTSLQPELPVTVEVETQMNNGQTPNCTNGSNQQDGNQCVGKGPSEFPSFHFYEGLVPSVEVPLTTTLTPSSTLEEDVVKQGYLGKMELSQRRYFVLREGSHTGPGRLEWYLNEEKFISTQKAARRTGLFGSTKQKVIYLRCCLGVNRIVSSRKGHTVAIYAKDQTLSLIAGDQREQEEWYLAIKKQIDEERRHGGDESFVEDDDGYGTLPPAAVFKEVWPVTVKPRGLGCTKSWAGEIRLCLSATSLLLVRVGSGREMPSVLLPLLGVRRFGHLDGLFFLELGRSAPHGPGEIWMQAGNQGDPALAQHMHDVVRETMRELRALPDFSHSPTSSRNHQPPCRAPLETKWSLARLKEKSGLGRIDSPPLTWHAESPGQPDLPADVSQYHRASHRQDQMDHWLPLSSSPQHPSTSEASSNTEMAMQDPLPGSDVMEDCDGEVSSVTEALSCVPASKQEEGVGYMMMSPHRNCSPQDDYVNMASLQMHTWPAPSSSSSPLIPFNSCAIYSSSALHKSSHFFNETQQSDWLTSARPRASQSEMVNIKNFSPHQVALKSATRRCPVMEGTSMSSSMEIDLFPAMPSPVLLTSPGVVQPALSRFWPCTPGQCGPVQAVTAQSSIRRYWISSCLPSCLQPEDEP